MARVAPIPNADLLFYVRRCAKLLDRRCVPWATYRWGVCQMAGQKPKFTYHLKLDTKRDRFDWAALSVNGLLLLAAIFAAGFSGWLAFLTHSAIKHAAKDAEKQREVAIDTERRQLRAYTSMDWYPLEDFEESKIPRAGAKVTILGQTPAYDLSLITHIAALPYPLKGDVRNIPGPAVESVARTLLAPNQTASNKLGLTYAPNHDQFQIMNGAGYRIFVWGEVTYRDAFKIDRRTRFCWSFPHAEAGKPAPPADLCETGNCADDQCPP